MPNSPASFSSRDSLREMASVALPMVVSQASDTIMIFTDRLFLSHVSSELMNAAMGGGLTVYMMMSFFMGLTGYTTALVAQNLGAGRKEDCAKVTTQALIISVLAYPVILLCAPLARHWFQLMHIPDIQRIPQILYMDLLLYGVIINLVRSVLSGFFSGIGRTSVVMVASISAMVMNVILNYLFIFGHGVIPAMGIRGAAYGTLAASSIGVLILLAAYLRTSNRIEFQIANAWRFDKAVMSTFLRFGSPTGVEIFLVLLAFNGMVLLYHGQGEIVGTAATIALNWDLVSFVPLIGLEIGVTSLVGRYMGARRPDLAHQSVMAGIKLGLLYSSFTLFFFAGFPGVLVLLFRPETSVNTFIQAMPTAIWMVRWASVYVVVETFFIVFIGALRGAGDTVWAMGLSVSLHWMMVISLYVILHTAGGTPKQGWMSMVVLFTLSSLFVYDRYRRGHWRTLRVIEPPL